MSRFLTAVVLLSSMACAHKQRHPEDVKLRTCNGLLADTLRIQDRRAKANAKMRMIASDYRMRNISKRMFTRQKDRWFQRENAYATQVNQLYFAARENDCLNMVAQNEIWSDGKENNGFRSQE